MRKPSPADKDIITPEEAVHYYGLVSKKFRALLLENENLPFRIRYFGSRSMIIRRKLEKYLDEHTEIRSNRIWHKTEYEGTPKTGY